MELDFLSQVLKFIQDFGGLDTMAKIAGVLLLVIESMKVSFMAPLFAKLGKAQFLVGPLLGLAAGIIVMKPITAAGAISFALAGAGAPLLHDLLQAIKGLQGVSVVTQNIIDVISGLLGPKKQ